jgi:transcriptional regulator with XRE-family HTH domain
MGKPILGLSGKDEAMNRRNEPEGMRPLRERGAALGKFRLEAGLTQEELGKLSGLAESSISRFESGERDLSAASFARVQEVILDLLSEKKALEKIAALRGHKSLEKIISPQTLAQLLETNTEDEVNAVLSQMPEDQRKEFVSIFEARIEEMRSKVEKQKAENAEMRVEIEKIKSETLNLKVQTVQDLEELLQAKNRRIELRDEHIRHLTDARPLAVRSADLEARMAATDERMKSRAPVFNALLGVPTNSLLERLLNGEPPARSLEEQLDREERGYQMTELRQLVREEEQAQRIAKLEEQNSSLLEWLTAEERAAIAHEKATELHDKASRPSED